MKNMRSFFTLYGYELKKISKRKMVWITVAVVIFLAVFILEEKETFFVLKKNEYITRIRAIKTKVSDC